MDLKTFRSIAPGLDKEIADVCLKYGLKVGKRGATINDREGTIAMRLTLIDNNLKDETGAKTTPEALRFKQTASYIGLKPEWLNQPVKVGSKTYRIVGMRLNRCAKPILYSIEGKPGSNYIADCETVRTWFSLPRERSLEEMRAAAIAASAS